MFNLFFRRYVPGFRVGPVSVPGFNIDDRSLLQGASASSEGALPDSVAQRYLGSAQIQSPDSISFSLPGAEGWVLSAPLIGSPGFRVSPQDDVAGFNVGPQDDAPGFNLDENGAPQQKTTWSDGLRPGSVALQDLNAPQLRTPPRLFTPAPQPGLPGLPGLWITRRPICLAFTPTLKTNRSASTSTRMTGRPARNLPPAR